MDEDVPLHDIVGEIPKGIKVVGVSIGRDVSCQLFGRQSGCDNIEECGLSRPRGSHDGSEFASLEDSRHVLEQFFLSVLLEAWERRLFDLFI